VGCGRLSDDLQSTFSHIHDLALVIFRIWFANHFLDGFKKQLALFNVVVKEIFPVLLAFRILSGGSLSDSLSSPHIKPLCPANRAAQIAILSINHGGILPHIF
jgi:hypothetical protein